MPSSGVRTETVHRQVRHFDWHDLYFDALLETDSSRASSKMKRARVALSKRLTELQKRDSQDHANEMADVESALTYLNLLLLLLEENSGRCWAVAA